MTKAAALDRLLQVCVDEIARRADFAAEKREVLREGAAVFRGVTAGANPLLAMYILWPTQAG